MVFGGAMHPDQDAEHPWLPGEAAFIGARSRARVPLLGVCLGSQLIARAAGAGVGPAATAEVGWFPVELNEAGRADPVLGALPRSGRGVRVALLHLRPARGRHVARRERRRAPGLPHRRPRLGDPVPRGGHARDGRALVRRGRGELPKPIAELGPRPRRPARRGTARPRALRARSSKRRRGCACTSRVWLGERAL